MKTKFFAILLGLFLSAFALEVNAQSVRVSSAVSVYVNIPIAPEIVINVGVNTAHAPASNYIWIEGHYNWNPRFNMYVWVDGYWALPPHRGAIWMPGYWEHTPYGYRWVNAYWAPHNHRMVYGHYHGRYDYFGRPVYYHKPNKRSTHGYAYCYDHNPHHRGKSFSSSAHYNAPRSSYADKRSADNGSGRMTNTSGRSSREAINQSNNGSRREAVSTRETVSTRTSRPQASNNASVNSRGSNTNERKQATTVTNRRSNNDNGASYRTSSGRTTSKQTTESRSNRTNNQSQNNKR